MGVNEHYVWVVSGLGEPDRVFHGDTPMERVINVVTGETIVEQLRGARENDLWVDYGDGSFSVDEGISVELKKVEYVS